MNTKKYRFSPIFHSTLAFCILLLTSVFSSAQTLKADYQFQGNLNSSVGTAPPLTDLVPAGNTANSFGSGTVDGYARQVLNFPANNGVNIPDLTSIVPDTTKLTIVMLFQFTDSQMQSKKLRLFDYSACQSQTGGRYLLNGKIEGEAGSHAASRQFSYFQVVITRSGVGSNVTIYRDGQVATTEPDDGTVLTSGLRFFHDCAWGLATTGSVARIRVYDGVMTAQQVHALDRVPESTAGTQPVLFYSNRSGVNEIYRMNTDGDSQLRITNNDAKPELYGKFSPNGQKIVYQRRETGADPWQIWTSNADGSNPVRLTNTATIDKAPSWRPDGQKILFSRCNGGVCDLFTMNPDGSNQAAVSTTSTDEDLATFTPDGTKLVFSCSDSNLTNYQICISNADGSNRLALTNTVAPVVNVDARVSPDGNRIVYVSAGPTPLIKVMNLDGSNVVTWPSVNNPQLPLWSPDGTKIMYSRSVGAFLEVFMANVDGASPVQITVNSADDIATDWYRPRSIMFDFDGDSKADRTVYRPGEGNWYVYGSEDGYTGETQWGIATDRVVAADYDGDGRTDHAVYRDGTWWVLGSNGGASSVEWGISTDVPVPADYDGDGKADMAVYRDGTWWILYANGSGASATEWGISTDVPVPADYDGDGKADLAVYRDGTWWVMNSNGSGVSAIEWGISTDKPVPADYDGDGKTDRAVYRDGTWWIMYANGSVSSTEWGISTDKPVPADYDGDGKADLAVYRDGDWWVINSNGGGAFSTNWGLATDRPIPQRSAP